MPPPDIDFRPEVAQLLSDPVFALPPEFTLEASFDTMGPGDGTPLEPTCEAYLEFDRELARSCPLDEENLTVW